jgi:hypothetical protein
MQASYSSEEKDIASQDNTDTPEKTIKDFDESDTAVVNLQRGVVFCISSRTTGTQSAKDQECRPYPADAQTSYLLSIHFKISLFYKVSLLYPEIWTCHSLFSEHSRSPKGKRPAIGRS